MVLYLCVLIVFSLHRESLKLILVTNPFPRWFCHRGAFIGIGVVGSGRGRRRNGWQGDGDLIPRRLELKLPHGVKEGGGKMGEHMASEVMRELLMV
jgi:hypothetical protein